MLEKDFKDIVYNIKKDIRNTQINSIRQVNNNMINLYFRIGKILFENSKYGNSFIKNVSTEINLTYPNLKGFSYRNLRRMKLFYTEYKDNQNWPQLVANLPWGHNTVLIEKIKDKSIRKLYAEECIKNGWSRDVLIHQIESNYHLRIGNSSNNFKDVLDNSDLVNNTFKDPYIFDFLTLKEKYSEKELEKSMMEKLKNLLLEFGKGFAFIGNQYKISTENNDYYIDLLFYHLELKRYIVIELKATSFKPEYIGQLGFYVKAVDHLLKKESDNETIGLLLCKEKDKLSVKWSLESLNVPMGITSYKLDKYLPKEILDKLPTEDDINMHI